MKTVQKCLLAQRMDGLFLRLDEQANTTSYGFVAEPELAHRIDLWYDTHDINYTNPKAPPYYFENSPRARDLWLKNCVMVAYEVTTETTAVRRAPTPTCKHKEQEDLDLHRYHCCDCKKVFYYSEAARAFYEDGVTCNVEGLDKPEST